MDPKSIDPKSVDPNQKSRHMGRCIIFNHRKYDPSTGQSERVGTEFDVEKLYDQFSSMGFIVTQYDDLRVGQLLDIIFEGMTINLAEITAHTMLQ
jgi:hypothetical protein